MLGIIRDKPISVADLPSTIPRGTPKRGGCACCGGGTYSYSEMKLYLPGDKLPSGSIVEDCPVYYGGTGSAEQMFLATDVFVLRVR